jgi:hypothetical protein
VDGIHLAQGLKAVFQDIFIQVTQDTVSEDLVLGQTASSGPLQSHGEISTPKGFIRVIRLVLFKQIMVAVPYKSHVLTGDSRLSLLGKEARNISGDSPIESVGE